VTERRPTPFNSPLETGVRALVTLAAAFPRAHDLHRLVQYGLQLMISRELRSRQARQESILYRAEEHAGPFLDNLQSPYMLELRERGGVGSRPV
jgi:hypothetical protein